MSSINRQSLRNFVKWVLEGLTDLTVTGTENVPMTGGIILATNHMSRLDTPLLLAGIPRNDLGALVAHKYRFNPLFAFMVWATDSFWINREITDYHAIRAGVDALRKGRILGIAPEGTRSRVAALIHGKPGTALLAELSKAPILPVAIAGSETVMRGIMRLKKPPVRIQFGKPFKLPALDRENREEGLKRNTDEIMCRIAAMLPEKYWGVYADHPRLKEILQSGAAV